MPAAVVAGAEDVVEGQPGVIERPAQERRAIDREQERLERHEVWRQTQQARPLGERLPDERQVQLFQVAQSAMDEPRRP